jgi:hypothetical protein
MSPRYAGLWLAICALTFAGAACAESWIIELRGESCCDQRPARLSKPSNPTPRPLEGVIRKLTCRSATALPLGPSSTGVYETRNDLAKELDDAPQLTPQKVVITLKFVVKDQGGPTGQITFLAFTIGGGVTLTSENANSIILTFEESRQP